MAKMSSKERIEADTEAALSMVESEDLTLAIKIKKMQTEKAEREKREKLIAETYRMFGQIQTADMMKKFSDVSSLVWLKQVKDTQIYKDIPGVETWERFCNRLGYSRQLIDRRILDLRVLGEEFLLSVSSFKVGYRDLQKLRWAANEGEITIEDGLVRIGENEIPINDDHKEDLKAAIEHILEEKQAKEAEVKKLKKRHENIVTEEIKNLTTERDCLVKENRRLKVFDPEEKEPETWMLEQGEEIKKAAIQFRSLCARFILDERIRDNMHIQARVMGSLTEARTAIMELERLWDLKFNPYHECP